MARELSDIVAIDDFPPPDPDFDPPADGDAPAVLAQETQRIAQLEARIEALPTTAAASIDVNYLAEVRKLLDDIRMLREHSMKIDPKTGQPKIYNAIVFEKAVRARAQILKMSMEVLRDVWDVKAMHDFYDAVIRCVAAESPACAHRIIRELSNLNPPVAGALARAIDIQGEL